MKRHWMFQTRNRKTEINPANMTLFHISCSSEIFVRIPLICFHALLNFSLLVQNLHIHLDSHNIKLLTVEWLWMNNYDNHTCGKMTHQAKNRYMLLLFFSLCSQNALQLDGLKEKSIWNVSLSCQAWIHSNSDSATCELDAQWSTTLSLSFLSLSLFSISSEETQNTTSMSALRLSFIYE